MNDQMPDPFLARQPWRVGRKVGRTIYAMVGPEASDDDVLIGMLDTRELARAAVEQHNAHLEHAQAPGRERRTEVSP